MDNVIFKTASEWFLKKNRGKLEAASPARGRKGGGKGGGTRPKGPNKTEARFSRDCLKGQGIYEGLTFHLPGGSRYTPDWIVFDCGRVIAYEVKGGYRFPSEGRALTAFREARAAFPAVTFEWYVLTGSRFHEKHAAE